MQPTPFCFLSHGLLCPLVFGLSFSVCLWPVVPLLRFPVLCFFDGWIAGQAQCVTSLSPKSAARPSVTPLHTTAQCWLRSAQGITVCSVVTRQNETQMDAEEDSDNDQGLGTTQRNCQLHTEPSHKLATFCHGLLNCESFPCSDDPIHLLT